MTRKLFTHSKIFFSNPHVIRVEFSTSYDNAIDGIKHKELVKSTYNTVGSTWGYSKLIREIITASTYNECATIHLSGTGINLQPLLYDPGTQVNRAYFCFKESDDALLFKLKSSLPTFNVSMWPETLFTIHEID